MVQLETCFYIPLSSVAFHSIGLFFSLAPILPSYLQPITLGMTSKTLLFLSKQEGRNGAYTGSRAGSRLS